MPYWVILPVSQLLWPEEAPGLWPHHSASVSTWTSWCLHFLFLSLKRTLCVEDFGAHSGNQDDLISRAFISTSYSMQTLFITQDHILQGSKMTYLVEVGSAPSNPLHTLSQDRFCFQNQGEEIWKYDYAHSPSGPF